jgi:hypothetical protein
MKHLKIAAETRCRDHAEATDPSFNADGSGIEAFMSGQQTNCSYCKVVNTLCLWDPLPPASWKRPVLVLCALPFFIGVPFLFWISWGHQETGALWLLGIPLFLLSGLGLLVAVSGCNACVSRLFGEL